MTLRTTSLRRVSRLFLSMGLRHLLVVESCPKVVGVITRKDLIYGGEAEGAPGAAPNGGRSRALWTRVRARTRSYLRGASPDMGRRPSISTRASPEWGVLPLRSEAHGRMGSCSMRTPMLQPNTQRAGVAPDAPVGGC